MTWTVTCMSPQPCNHVDVTRHLKAPKSVGHLEEFIHSPPILLTANSLQDFLEYWRYQVSNPSRVSKIDLWVPQHLNRALILWRNDGPGVLPHGPLAQGFQAPRPSSTPSSHIEIIPQVDASKFRALWIYPPAALKSYRHGLTAAVEGDPLRSTSARRVRWPQPPHQQRQIAQEDVRGRRGKPGTAGQADGPNEENSLRNIDV